MAKHKLFEVGDLVSAEFISRDEHGPTKIPRIAIITKITEDWVSLHSMKVLTLKVLFLDGKNTVGNLSPQFAKLVQKGQTNG